MEEVIDVVAEPRGSQLARRAPKDVALSPVMDLAVAKKRLDELQVFCAGYLQESKDGGNDGGDYGVIPGAGKKKVLLKSGADKLCDVYGLADRYRIISKVEDFAHGLFDYTIECELVRKTDEMFVGSGLGSCSSWESKYRWRESKRKCPQCQSDAIIRGKAEYGGGWLCWAKKGGCGAKFADSDPAIVDQPMGRIENEDIIDTKNTVLKMAKKRSKIDAVIGVTRSSGLFTQDLEDLAGEMASEAAQAASAAGPVVQAVPATISDDETHAQKIARVKAEAAVNRPKPADAAAPVQAPKPVKPAVVAPPASPMAPVVVAPVAPVVAPPDGTVLITGINVRNGPLVVKDGKTVPAWGPLYVIAFSHKVKATDGVSVSDATTFDEKLAKAAEDSRDAHQADATAGFVKPKVDPGKKKGSYNLVAFE